jgi:hypothetical protein
MSTLAARVRLLPSTSILLVRLLQALLVLAPLQATASCAADDPPLLSLQVVNDHVRSVDRSLRIHLHQSGCVAIRRPGFHRAPGQFRGVVKGEQLATLTHVAGSESLRAMQAEAVLAAAEAEATASRAAGIPPIKRYISHPTVYVLDFHGRQPAQMRFDSVFQFEAFYPEAPAVAEAARAVRAMLALDELDGLQAVVVQP